MLFREGGGGASTNKFRCAAGRHPGGEQSNGRDQHVEMPLNSDPKEHDMSPRLDCFFTED